MRSEFARTYAVCVRIKCLTSDLLRSISSRSSAVNGIIPSLPTYFEERRKVLGDIFSIRDLERDLRRDVYFSYLSAGRVKAEALFSRESTRCTKLEKME